MANLNTNINFVKFVRGTQSAWNKITNKDSNTLYFILNETKTAGNLYLGDKLILGGDSDSKISLDDLSNILTSENIPSNSLLVYDGVQEKWINKTLSDIFQVMVGASSTSDGVGGYVPTPAAGQENYFLRGDGVWAPVEETTSAEIYWGNF